MNGSPDDDASRLVYADELQEKHDPRGEFIALQIHAARLAPTDPRRNELLVRATQLLEVHRKDWSPLGLDWQFERGFPNAVQLHVSALRRHEAALQSVATLEDLEVRFTNAAPADLEGLLSLPLLQRVGALRFNWHTPHQLAVDLLQEPWVARLERLQLSWVMLPEQVWQVLGRVESPARHLPALDLMLADARDEFLQLLDPAPWPRLKWLRLSNGRLGTRGCGVLAQAGLFPALEHLDVSWNRIGKQGVALLAKSPLIHQLTSLDLSHCQIGDEGCAALAEAGPQALRWLSVEHSRVTAEGVDLLRAGLPSLQFLGA
ncbi:MAG: TIGR02996 domain-containing protein [Archangium sp.]|nr:TIGR02996 domain-containing protein [Archangium sp.]